MAAEPVSIEERSQPVDLGLPAPSVEPEWSGATLVSFLRTHPELRALIRSDAGEHLDGVAVALQRGAAPTVCVLAATAVEPRCVVLPADAPVTELGLTGYGESAGAVARQPLGDRDALFVLRARDGALLGPIVVERGEAELSSMDERLDGAPEVAVEMTAPDGAVAELLRGLLRARRLEVAPLSTWRSGDAVGGVHVIERDAARVCLSTPDWHCSAAGDFEFSTLGDYGDLYEYALWEPRSRRAFMVHHAWSNTNGVHSEDTMSDRLDVFGDDPLRVLGSMPLGELVSLSRDVGRKEGGAWQPRRAVVSVSWCLVVDFGRPAGALPGAAYDHAQAPACRRLASQTTQEASAGARAPPRRRQRRTRQARPHRDRCRRGCPAFDLPRSQRSVDLRAEGRVLASLDVARARLPQPLNAPYHHGGKRSPCRRPRGSPSPVG